RRSGRDTVTAKGVSVVAGSGVSMVHQLGTIVSSAQTVESCGLVDGSAARLVSEWLRLNGGFGQLRTSSTASKTLCSLLETPFRNRAFPNCAHSQDSRTIDWWALLTACSCRQAFAIHWRLSTSERSN